MIGRTARTGGATRSVRPAGGGVPASEFRDRTSGASEVNEPAAREGKGAATRSPDMSVATHSASDRGHQLPGIACAGKVSCLGRRFLSDFPRPGSSWSGAFRALPIARWRTQALEAEGCFERASATAGLFLRLRAGGRPSIPYL